MNLVQVVVGMVNGYSMSAYLFKFEYKRISGDENLKNFFLTKDVIH